MIRNIELGPLFILLMGRGRRKELIWIRLGNFPYGLEIKGLKWRFRRATK